MNKTKLQTGMSPTDNFWWKQTGMSVGIALCLMVSMVFFTALDAMGNKLHRATIVDADGTFLEERDGAIHEDDSLALVAMYHSLHVEHWRDNAGWLEDRVDFWVGVNQVANVGTTEDPEWRVTRISLPQHNMTRAGELPPELGNMAHLQRFLVPLSFISGGLEYFAGLNRLEIMEFRSNLLTGEIPWDILSELESLVRLGLRNGPKDPGENRFAGGIDPVIGEFPVLEILNLQYVGLSGPIPPEIQNITTLKRFFVNGNVHTGELVDMSNMTELERYEVSDNPFDPAPIPEWIRDLQEINILRLWNTNRTGTVPEWITDLITLSELGIGEGIWNDEAADHPDWQAENMLGGEIPDLSAMPNLGRLRIHGPGFTGPIPEWIADIPSLQEVYFIDTGFEGPIPGDLFTASEMTRIYVRNNRNLTGGLPLDMQLATGLERIHIADNPQMEIGELPDWLGNMTSARELHLENMRATGNIPESMSNLTALVELNVMNNPGITGPIPAWASEREWIRFDLSRTGMDIPSIPEWLQNKTGSLGRLSLAGLGMTGELPEWIGDFTQLGQLNLDDNNLSGPLPASLGNLFTLDSLSLGNNDFSGEIPVELGNTGRYTEVFSGLKAFSVADNPDLTGEIPLGFTDAILMRTFEYANTGLCEPADESFHNWLESIPDNSYEWYPPILSSVSRTNESCDPTDADNPALPNRLVLHQNYPNPFNPATTIAYEVPSDMHVTLTVYNVIGQRVATLVNENQSAGRFEVNFDASRFSTGTYMYRLEVGGRSLTNTMMLIK